MDTQPTLEQKAWQVSGFANYGELATTANQLDCSMDEAVEFLWQKHYGKAGDK